MKKKISLLLLPLLFLVSCGNKEPIIIYVDPGEGGGEIIPPEVTVTSIEVVDYVNEYNVGDTFVAPSVKVNYSDGTSLVVSEGVTFTGFDSSTAGSCTITATYNGVSVSFTVTIKEKETPRILVAIHLSNKKDTYYVNESFVKPTVTSQYSNGDTEVVTSSCTFTGFDSSKVGNCTIKVQYQNLSTTYQVSIIEEEEEFERKMLDCGYYQMYLPKNKDNPEELKTTLSADASSWSNNDLYDELPTYYRFIYGNSYDDGPSGERATPKFYSYDPSKTKQYPGGLKFDQKTKGFQSQLFYHSGAKLEFHIGISQVNDASDKPEEGKDFLNIYFFNKYGTNLGKYRVEAETITTKTTDLHFYITEDYTKDIAYFEVRQISITYKGSQCYNVGVSYCNYKSWERI